MSVQTLISVLPAHLPQDLLPQELLAQLEGVIPKDLDLAAVGKYLAIFCVCFLALSLGGRMVMGKRSSLNGALSSVMGVLFLYAATIVIYTFRPWSLEQFLSPLPFVTFGGEYLVILPISGSEMPYLCHEVLSLLILCFLVNLADALLPRGKNVISWYLSRFLSVIAAMAAHYLVRWAFDTFLPDVLVTYAPMILLGFLAVFLLMGLLNLVLGLVLTVVNPLLGGAYAFFFSNLVGKQITKSVITTLVVMLCFYAMEQLGYVVIVISAGALSAYLPVMIIALLLWYVVGHVL